MSRTDPSGEPSRRRLELSAALETRDALADILRAMASSPGDLDSIFAVILDKALRLCHAQLGIVFLYADGCYEAVAMRRRGGHSSTPKSLIFSRQGRRTRQ